MRIITAVLLSILTASCAANRAAVVKQPEPTIEIVHPPATSSTSTSPTISDVWQMTLLTVAPLVQRGDFPGADSVLAYFGNSHANTCEGSESNYVRALLRLAPGNTVGKVETAAPLLDSYLASGCVSPGRAAEVVLLRKVAADLQRESVVADSSSAEQIRKLREQLEQTKKELDRLKMRVIPPRRDTTRIIPP